MRQFRRKILPGDRWLAAPTIAFRIDLEVPVEIADRAGLAEMFAPQRRDGMALHQALDLALGIALPARAGPSRGGPSRIQSVCSS